MHSTTLEGLAKILCFWCGGLVVGEGLGVLREGMHFSLKNAHLLNLYLSGHNKTGALLNEFTL